MVKGDLFGKVRRRYPRHVLSGPLDEGYVVSLGELDQFSASRRLHQRRMPLASVFLWRRMIKRITSCNAQSRNGTLAVVPVFDVRTNSLLIVLGRAQHPPL